jgi:uncharacterized membrane protein
VHHDADKSPWIVTLLYASGALTAGLVLPRLEHFVLPHLASPIGASAAMAIYSSIASGMLALTGIVFSLTFVLVQFSATAYSPRLVLWFSRDPLVAHAFGTFTATFLYALAALAWVDRSGTNDVPLVSSIVVVLLLLASIGMFVGLIHRVTMLQINRTLAFTGDRGREVIEDIYPALAPGPAIQAATGAASQVVVRHGPPLAVKRVQIPQLVAMAAAADAVIEVLVAVGDTVAESTPIARVDGARAPLDEQALLSTVVLGVERTFEQDPKYAIRLLVDIAIRALSPAVNDPTTAVQALDQIGDLLLRLGRRCLEVGTFRDGAGRVRVLMAFPTWEDFLRLAFGEIAAYGADSLQVMRRMNALVADLIAAVPRERRPALEYWRERLHRSVARSFADPEQRAAALMEDRQGLGVSRRPPAA